MWSHVVFLQQIGSRCLCFHNAHTGKRPLWPRGNKGWMSGASGSYPMIEHRWDEQATKHDERYLFSALHAQRFDLLEWSVLILRRWIIGIVGKSIGFDCDGTNAGEERSGHGWLLERTHLSRGLHFISWTQTAMPNSPNSPFAVAGMGSTSAAHSHGPPWGSTTTSSPLGASLTDSFGQSRSHYQSGYMMVSHRPFANHKGLNSSHIVFRTEQCKLQKVIRLFLIFCCHRIYHRAVSASMRSL